MQEDLKYMSSEKYYEGVITEVKGGAVSIDLKGRMGRFDIPNRMLITDCVPKPGHEVGFMLSNPEVLYPDSPNEEYIRKIEAQKKIAKTAQNETLTRLEKQILEKRAEVEKLEKRLQELEDNIAVKSEF